MASGTVTLNIPVETLIEAISSLDLDDKCKLLDILEQQVAEAEEEQWEQDPAVQAKIQEARAAYEAGDYITLEEYLAQQQDED